MRTHRIQARKTLIRGCSLRYPSFCETAIRSILTPFGKIFCGGLNAFIHASQLAGSFLECVVEKEWGWARLQPHVDMLPKEFPKVRGKFGDWRCRQNPVSILF